MDQPSIVFLSQVRESNISGIKKALKDGADIDIISHGEFALKHVAIAGNLPVAKLLLDNGANVDLTSGDRITALMKACECGNTKIAKLLLDRGAVVDLSSKDGRTALMIACKHGNTKIAKMLLIKGAQVDLQDAQIKTALMYLCANTKMPETQFTKLAKLLVSPESVNKVDGFGRSALMIALQSENFVAVNTLLSFRGIYLDIQDLDGLSVLMMASKTSRIEYIKAFLERGADANLKNMTGQTALVLACKNKKPDNAKLLLSNGVAHVDFRGDNGYFVLAAACENGWTGLAEQLVENGIPVNIGNSKGHSPLMRACIAGRMDTARVLLKKGANVDLEDSVGKTALILACENKKQENVRLLLNNGAHVDFKGDKGYLVLATACENGWTELAEQLIENGVPVNIRNSEGHSPLMKACIAGRIDTATVLLKKGANVDLEDSVGKTALILACENKRLKNVRLLVNKARYDFKGDGGYLVLSIAYENGWTELIELLIEQGVPIDTRNSEGQSLFMRACIEGRMDMVRVLLNKGANIDLQDNDGKTALMRACVSKLYSLTEFLLLEGANPNMQNSAGMSALMMVCTLEGYKYTDIIKLLLEHGANVDLQDGTGRTALVLACQNKKLESVRLLLSNGAHVDFKGDKGGLVLVTACENGWTELVEQLIEQGVPVDVRNREGQSNFIKECIGEKMDMGRLLLKKGANIDLQDNSGKTALMRACELKMYDLTEFLLLGGADPNVQSIVGMSALMIVSTSSSSNSDIIKLLLKHGANVDLQDRAGRTALMKACIRSHSDHVKLLINHGANIDIQDYGDFESALMLVAENNDLDLTKLLLEKGAKVYLKDRLGETALHRACCGKHVSTMVVELLLCYGPNLINLQNNAGMSPLMLASARGYTEIAELLLHSGADVDLRLKTSGQTALMIACKMKFVEMAKLLLHNGAQVDLQDCVDTTALMIACGSESIEITKLLLQRGAEVNLQNKEGQTALMKAGGRKSVLRMLLARGAKVDTQDHTGQTALSIACKNGYISNIELLLKSGAKVDSLDANNMSVLKKLNAYFSFEVRQIIKIQTHSQNEEPAEESTLIIASSKGDKDTIEQLLSEGAEIESKDSKGRTALITASGNGHTMVTDLLLERGAHIDSQDDQGYSALMTACENGHVQTTSRLLDEDADTFLKNSEGKTAFDLAMENSNAELLPLFTKLRSKPSYPGILFLEGAKRESVTTKKKTIDLEEVGISLLIPEGALPPTDPPLQLEIQPCFSGSFDVPPNIELVSPAYIVSPCRKVSFQKKVLVKMWHHANLESEEDCEDMVFLSASTSPEYRGDTPVYVFREIKGAKGSFRPGEEQPVGQIALKHFCTLSLGKRHRREDDEPKFDETSKKHKGEDNKQNIKSTEQCSQVGNLYSARLYKTSERKVIFCICLCHPLYIDNCNKVMSAQYGAPDKKIHPIQPSNGVKIISDEVHLTQSCPNGWAAVIKKRPALISKDEINLQEIYEIRDLLKMDYPPKIEVVIQSVPTSPDSGPLCLHVDGLNRECVFILLPGDISGQTQQVTVDTSKIKVAMTELKDEIQEQSVSSCASISVSNYAPPSVSNYAATPESTLLPTACEMLVMMEALEQLLQHCSSDSYAPLHCMVDEMEKKSQRLKERAEEIARYLKIRYDMDGSVERANTLAVQMKMVYQANMQHCDTSEWQCAVGLFVTNAANLMKAIKDTLRASKLAMTLPNNYFPISQTTENTTSVATLCGPSQPPQIYGGRTHFQSPLNMHVGGTGSSTYPHPPHSTVFQPHVAPGGTNTSYPLSPYTISTSTQPSVPSTAGAPIASGGEILYPNSPHKRAGTTATSLPPTIGASVVSGGNNISYPQSPPLVMSLPPCVPSTPADALGLLCPQPTAMTFTGATVLSSQLPPDITDLALSDSSLFCPGTAESDVQFMINTSQTLYHQPSMFSPTAHVPATDHQQQHIPLSPPTPLSHPTLSPTTAVPSQPSPKPLAKEHMADICKCLFSLRARWKTIGTFLCVDHNNLDAIRANYEDCEDRLTELIAVWLRQLRPPPTGQALADAVQYISPDKAEEIRQIFLV